MVPARWSHFRQQMPVTDRWAYLDHAAVAPLPGPTATAIQDWARQAATEGDTAWPAWSRRLQEVRQRVAESAQCAARRGRSGAQHDGGNRTWWPRDYPWRAGDNVVTLDNEFPSNLYPWLNLADRGVQTRRVPCDRGRVDVERLIAACDRADTDGIRQLGRLRVGLAIGRRQNWPSECTAAGPC